MRPSPKTTLLNSRRHRSLSLAAAAALVLASQSAPAAVLTWDIDPLTPGVQNGSGIWNTTDLTWSTEGATWNNSTPDSVIFGGGSGAAGTVTLGSDITVGNITFDAAGSGNYTIAGSGKILTLSNTTISGAAAATISATLTGTTGLTVTNTGGITLTGTNTYSGTTQVGSNSGGVSALLRVNSAQAFGNSRAVVVTSSASLQIGDGVVAGDGMTLAIAGNGTSNAGGLQAPENSSGTWAGTLVLNAGARVGTRGGGILTLSGPIKDGTQGGLSISAFTSNGAGGVVIISGTENTYTGITGIVRGTLKLGAHNALPTGTILDVDSASANEDSTFDLDGFNQTIAELQRTNANGGAGGSFITNNGSTAATLTINQASGTKTYNGIIRDGTTPGGVLSLTKSNNGTLTLTGANTYTGTTTVESTNGNGKLQLNGAGTLASANFQLNSGSLIIDNTGTNNNNRLFDSAKFTLNGGTLEYKGHTSGSTETIGEINFGRGLSKITLTHATGSSAVIAADRFTRTTGGGVAFINGADLGIAGSSNAARLTLTNAPALVGAGNAATNKGIVPYLLGEVGSTTGTPNTFVTYDASNGLRPLTMAEFESDVVTGANVRITADAAKTDTATINSLILAAATDKVFTINNGQTLTNTSGAVLFAETNRIAGGTLNFGDAEGIVTVNANKIGIIGSAITGTKGLSISGLGTFGLGSANSTYSGETVLHSGTTVPQVSSSGTGSMISGPFGSSTVVFAGGQIRTTGTVTPIPTTIGNPLRFEADTNFVGGGGSDFDFTGNATLTGGVRTLNLTSGKNVIFSGEVSGAQAGDGLAVAGFSNSSVILVGDATYQGPTVVKSSTLNISGSITGSSSVTVENAGTLTLSGFSGFSFGGEDDPVDPGRIGDNIPLILGNSGGNGGALLKIDNSTDTMYGVTFNETLGSLTLGNDAIIDLGEGDYGTILRFAASRDLLWSGTLSIYNWTDIEGLNGRTDQIYFGSSNSGLLAEQLAQIRIYSDAGGDFLGHGRLLETGELVVAAIPEPSTALSLLAMLGGVLGGRRLRRRTTARS